MIDWNAIELFLSLPNGVLATDLNYQGIVETSSNIGIAADEAAHL